MDVSKANLLIASLKENPEHFFDQGKSYDLLQEYFRGFPIISLAKLLGDKNKTIRKSAIWIASELDEPPISLVDQIVPLIMEDDRYIKYTTLETIMRISDVGFGGIFHHLINALECNDAIVRKVAMYLISNSDDIQLEEALNYFSKSNNCAHLNGLKFLIDADNMSATNIDQMLNDENELLPRYGAIFLRRNMKFINRQKIKKIIDQHPDFSIRGFLEDFLDE